MRVILFLSLLATLGGMAAAQEPDSAKAQRMQWFEDAKLGIFIHWGIYAVNGIDESWSFYNGYITYDDYMKQLAGFTAARYDPPAWARLIRESGARYAVLTTKHHDGVGLWETRQSDLNVVRKTPAARDLVTPFCEALRRENLKVGLYFSHLDWSHPDYPHFTRTEQRYEKDPARWERFLKFQRGQIEEIATKGHMDALAVVDTFGGLSPHAVPYLLKKIRERIKKPLETHFHMDFGMGVANTIIALAAGAEVVHSTISGIGERAGNVPTEDTVLTLLTMYGVDTGIKTEHLTKLSRYVRKIAKLAMPANRQIVGDMVYDIESGIIASWFKNVGTEHLLEVFPIHWDLVGQRPAKVVLGKNSGLDSIKMHLQRLRVKATEEQVNELVLRVKTASLKKKGLVDDQEFRKMVKAVVKR